MKYYTIIALSILLIENDVFSQNDNTHSQDSISITYIANAGFLVEMSGKKIVFDGFFKDGFEKDEFPDSNLIFQMKNSRPPFDNIDIAILHNSFGSINLLNLTESLINVDNYIFMHLSNDFVNMYHSFFNKSPEIISNPYIFREQMEKKTYIFNDK